MVAVILASIFLWDPQKNDPPPSLRNSNRLASNTGKLYHADESTPYTGPVTEYHPNGNKSYSVHFKDGVPHGPVIEWHENSQKKTDATLINGQAVGYLRGWHEN